MRTKSLLTIFICFTFILACNQDKYLVDKNGHTAIEKDGNPVKLASTPYLLKTWSINGNEYSYFTSDSIMIMFDAASGKIQGRDGCNNFFGSYQIDQGQLKVGPTGGTKMYCGDKSADAEAAFHEFLKQDISIKIKKNILYLTSGTQEVTFKTLE